MNASDVLAAKLLLKNDVWNNGMIQRFLVLFLVK